MKSLLPLKIVFLTAMLVGVVYTIRNLNTGSVEKALESAGLRAGGDQAPGLHRSSGPLGEGEKLYNLCPTRVHAIVWNERRKVEEFRDGMKLKWIAVNPAPRELGYMEVEKWLSAHCKVGVRPVEPRSAGYSEFVTVRYIDGTEVKLERASDGSFLAKTATPEAFASPDLTRALEELEKIAQLTSVETP